MSDIVDSSHQNLEQFQALEEFENNGNIISSEPREQDQGSMCMLNKILNKKKRRESSFFGPTSTSIFVPTPAISPKTHSGVLQKRDLNGSMWRPLSSFPIPQNPQPTATEMNWKKIEAANLARETFFTKLRNGELEKLAKHKEPHDHHSIRATVIQSTRPCAQIPSDLRRDAPSSSLSTNLYRRTSVSILFAPPRQTGALDENSSNAVRENTQDLQRALEMSSTLARSTPNEESFQRSVHSTSSHTSTTSNRHIHDTTNSSPTVIDVKQQEQDIVRTVELNMPRPKADIKGAVLDAITQSATQFAAIVSLSDSTEVEEESIGTRLAQRKQQERTHNLKKPQVASIHASSVHRNDSNKLQLPELLDDDVVPKNSDKMPIEQSDSKCPRRSLRIASMNLINVQKSVTVGKTDDDRKKKKEKTVPTLLTNQRRKTSKTN